MGGVPIQPTDARRYFMLPQSPEESGYYVYGTPAKGAFQYAHPTMMTVLLAVERKWAALDNRQFGIGNISLASGPDNDDHDSHEDGLQVDIRPLRQDGLQRPVSWKQASLYDRIATRKLIGLFFSHPDVTIILFNDVSTHPRVKPWRGHDNHFHVALKAPGSVR